MHELSITKNILEIALDHNEDSRNITDIYLVIGQLSSLVDDSIQFYWDIISRDTLAQGAQLHFQRIPAEMYCQGCHQTYILQGDFTCPNCGGDRVQVIAGEEFYIEAIDIESEGVPHD
jgi:hydrogenase nickel incorporation protein HypA/HybF